MSGQFLAKLLFVSLATGIASHGMAYTASKTKTHECVDASGAIVATVKTEKECKAPNKWVKITVKK